MLKRFFLLMAAGIALLPTAVAQSNPIVIENQQPGTSNWQIPWGYAGNDVSGQIKGYASATSVNKGQNITFYVSVNPAQTYTIDVYRMGWYQGLGGRLMQHVGPLNGVRQATCPTDSATGMIECRWAASYTLATQTTWTSGIYLALLTNAQNYQNYIVFCVRDDNRVAPLLFQQTVMTLQAYSDYPYDNQTGKSLYGFNSYGAPTPSYETPGAAKVSFDRPYSDGGLGWGDMAIRWEIPFVHWMEMSGYDVTYQTDIDTHVNPSRLLNYRALLSVGHDEYWTRAMYDGWIAALNAGVNLAFFGANSLGWQVRFEPSSTGVPNRVMVCYKQANTDPVTDPALKTVMWRDSLLNRPEQTLVGVQYANQVYWNPYQTYDGHAPYVVRNSSHWVYAGTGFRDGDSVPGIVGYEADRLFSQYPGPNAVSGTYTLLSNSPFTTTELTSGYSNSSVYQAPSGAWVFASGTMGWAFGLDNSGYNQVDSRIQKTTTNILNRFITPSNNFSLAASPSSQTVLQGGATSYNVTISPTGGFTGQVTLSVNGLPSGATPSFAPNPATTSSTLSVTTSTSTPTGTYALTITGTSGTLTNTTSITLVVNPLPDFSLSPSPASRTINPGAATSYSVAINSIGGFSGAVTLSVAGQPSGVTPSFTPNPATTSSTLSVTTNTSTPPGTYTLTITGTSGSLTRTTTVQLVVTTPDFALVVSPSSQTINPGSTTSYSVAINSIAGFAGQVTLAVSGLPTGANGTFNPNPATTSSTLSVTTSTSTPAGAYTLTITGTSGALMHSLTVSLTVTPPGVKYDNAVSSKFQWGVTMASAPVTVGSGRNRAAMIMVAMDANNATNITANLGGVPATLVPGTDTGTVSSMRTLIFCVINPPAGSQIATVSWTNSLDADVGVITVSGADQTTACTNGTNFATNSNPISSGSVTVTSNAGDLTATVAMTSGQWVSPFTNRTIKWGVDTNDAGGDIGPGTGTTTHSWMDQWQWQAHAISGANFKASATP